MEINELLKNIDCNNLIQSLSGIAAFITSLVTLFTLIVLIKQRKDSFRPRVIFGDRISATCIANGDDLFKSQWNDAYPDEEEEIIDFCFELINVGVGVAENVVVKESFDYKRAIRFIKELDTDNLFFFNKIGDTIEVTTAFDKSFTIIYLRNKPRELGNFISIQQEKPHKYVFTDSCLVFLSCFDYLRNKYDRYMSLREFPNCHYQIQYSDIEGKRYKAKYVSKVSSVLIDNYTFTFIKK